MAAHVGGFGSQKPWLKLNPHSATHTARRSAACAATQPSGTFNWRMPILSAHLAGLILPNFFEMHVLM